MGTARGAPLRHTSTRAGAAPPKPLEVVEARTPVPGRLVLGGWFLADGRWLLRTAWGLPPAERARLGCAGGCEDGRVAGRACRACGLVCEAAGRASGEHADRAGRA